MKGSDFKEWLEAMHDEIGRLNSRKTLDSVVGAKWVFRTKRDEQGRVIGYRAVVPDFGKSRAT